MKLMRKITALLCAAVAFCAMGDETSVQSKIAWKLPTYSIVAQSMSLRECFKTFGAAQGMSVVMSKEVSGVVSGEFRDVKSDDFLDRVTTLYNLIWYYDGASLFLYGLDEVRSMLLSLKYMKVDEVRAVLQQLGIEDSRFPIRTASNDELILVSGPPRYVELIVETIARADSLREKRTFSEIETRIFPLKYTWADDVSFRVTGPETSGSVRGIATILRELMAESSSSGQTKDVTADAANPDAAGDAKKDAEKPADETPAVRPIIRAENRLNAVIVRDAVTRMPIYEKLIRQLDKPQKLVEIIVTKLEMTRKDALDWQLSLSVRGAHKEFAGAAGQNPANLSPELIGRGLAGTMSYVGDSVTVNGSLTALREKGKARNVSRTSLLTVNNMAARLTDTQSYHARVVGTEVASLESVNAGTKLEIKPRHVPSAGEDEPDRMWLSMQLSDGGFETVAVDSMPMKSESSLETQALVPVGESIMLAGYTRDVKEDGGWGIPYLRDIPWIGWLFGGKSSTTETVQRLFILTPRLIDADVASAMLREQAERNRDISEAMSLNHEGDKDHATRREEEARMQEALDIHEERAKDVYERNEAERKFRREKRRDVRDDNREDWKQDLNERREDYEEKREEVKKVREERREAYEQKREEVKKARQEAQAEKEETSSK